MSNNPFKKPKRLRQPHGPPQRLDQWLHGRNSELVVNRGELVTFVDEHTRTVLVPFIADCLKAYDAERQRRVWYRRILRWLRDKALGPDKPDQAEPHLAQARAERETEGEGDESKMEREEPPARRSCAACGSYNLMAIDPERGGLKCDRGHVIEEPEPIQAGIDRIAEAAVRDGRAPSTGLTDTTATAALAHASDQPRRTDLREMPAPDGVAHRVEFGVIAEHGVHPSQTRKEPEP